MANLLSQLSNWFASNWFASKWFSSKPPRASDTDSHILQQLGMIADVTSRLSSLEIAAESMINVSLELTHAGSGSIVIFDEEGEIVCTHLTQDFQEENHRAAVPQINEKGLVAWVAEHRKAVLIGNVLEDERWIRIAGDERPQSAICVPLELHGQLLAVLTLDYFDENTECEADFNLVVTAASQLAMAIYSTRLNAQHRQNIKHQEILYETLKRLTKEHEPDQIAQTALETISELTDWSWVAVAAFWKDEALESGYQVVSAHSSQSEETLDFLAVAKSREGVIGRALKDREVQVIQDTAVDPDYVSSVPRTTAEITVPFFRNDELFGWLDIQRSDSLPFDQRDIQLAESMADSLEIAFENAFRLRIAHETAVKMQELTELKSRFLANVSHEIRTPLNGILGGASLLKETGLDDYQGKWVKMILASGNLLLQVISDILDLSMIEANEVLIKKETVSISGVIDNALAIVKPLAGKKQLRLVTEIQEDCPQFIETDSTRLMQVLINLLNNAIKFTDQGSVTISAHRNLNDLVISVSDTGKGIPAGQLEEMFEPFRQLDNSTTRIQGGTGLGLAISSGLVELLDGRIWAENHDAGGARLSLELPIGLPSESEVAQSQDFPLHDFPSQEVEPAASENLNEMSARFPLNILIAEDSLANQEVLVSMLHEMGYQAALVTTGTAALREVSSKQFDCVLMDVHMPEMDGLEAITRIRSSSELKRQPQLIAVTAMAFDEDRDLCLAAGADDYLCKPYSFEQLTATLVRASRAIRQSEADSPIMAE